MSDSPRLDELLRQRALLQEHLAWLDREIAAEQSEQRAPTGPSPSPAAFSPTPNDAVAVRPQPAPAEVEAAETQAEAILAENRTPMSKLQQDVRLGCFLYFVAALAAVAAGVVALYFLLRHR